MDTPNIPTLKDTKKPAVKIRGMETSGGTFFDRLRQFKKKDLAFILAGLGVLLMAPLAEHFMMAPETGEGSLAPGWGKGAGGSGLFGGGGSPYEPGSSGLAPGNAIGGGSDVITPLNVRDPSTLVMGTSATPQPPAGSVAPPTPPPTAPTEASREDIRDALRAGSRGVSAASAAAKPVPSIHLSGSNLRGLGVTNGGSSTSASLQPISSKGLVGDRANAGGGLSNVRPAPGFKGVARGQTQGGGGLEALKKAGEAAGTTMNRGSAATALENAANQPIPGGGASFGGNGAGSTGANDKAFTGNQEKNSKNIGESLEFLKQKAIQDAQIDLWKKEQEAGDSKLEMLKMRNSIAEAIAGKFGGALGDAVTCPLTKNWQKCFNPSDAGFYLCWAGTDRTGDGTQVPGGTVGSCGDSGVQLYHCDVGGVIKLCKCSDTTQGGSGSSPTGAVVWQNCADQTAPGSQKKPDANAGQQAIAGLGQGKPQDKAWGLGAGHICKTLKDWKNSIDKSPDSFGPASKSWVEKSLTVTNNLVAIRMALLGGDKISECDPGAPLLPKSVRDLQLDVVNSLVPNATSPYPKPYLPQVSGLLDKTSVDGDIPGLYTPVNKAETAAQDGVAKVSQKCRSPSFGFSEDCNHMPRFNDVDINNPPLQRKDLNNNKAQLCSSTKAMGPQCRLIAEKINGALTDVSQAFQDAQSMQGKIKTQTDDVQKMVQKLKDPDKIGLHADSYDGTLGAVMAVNKYFKDITEQARGKKIPLTPNAVDGGRGTLGNGTYESTRTDISKVKNAMDGTPANPNASQAEVKGLAKLVQEYKAPEEGSNEDPAKAKIVRVWNDVYQGVITMRNTHAGWIGTASAAVTDLRAQLTPTTNTQGKQ